MSFADQKRDARLIRDEERQKRRGHIKGEEIRTLSGSQHDGTTSFQKRVNKGRAAAKTARKARKRNRGR